MTPPAGPAGGVPSDGTEPAGAPTGPEGRVVTVQRQVRPTLLLAAAFAVASPMAAALPHRTGRWLPLHLFLVGALLLAISGATQLFAVTWAAGPPAPRRLVAAQRLLLAAGAAGLAAGRELDVPGGLLAVPGLAVAAALALLAVALEGIVGNAVQRRFDASLRWYRAALAAGGIGVLLGVVVATGALPADSTARVGDAHAVLNLLGLVGLVVAGTLPFFVATQAKMRMSPRARTGLQDRVRRIMVTALAASAAAALAGRPEIAGVALAGYAAGQMGLILVLPRPGGRQLRWAGPRLLHLTSGLLWWTGSVLAMAWSLLRGGPALPAPALLALAVGGYAQILAASLAYLGPVLRGGGHERLAAGFAVTASWWGLVAGNAAAAAVVTGHAGAGGVLLGAWVLDTAWRARRLLAGEEGPKVPRPAPDARPNI